MAAPKRCTGSCPTSRRSARSSAAVCRSAPSVVDARSWRRCRRSARCSTPAHSPAIRWRRLPGGPRWGSSPTRDTASSAGGQRCCPMGSQPPVQMPVCLPPSRWSALWSACTSAARPRRQTSSRRRPRMNGSSARSSMRYWLRVSPWRRAPTKQCSSVWATPTRCSPRSARPRAAPRPPPSNSCADLTSTPMRQFVSLRFSHAIAALIWLTYGLWYFLVRKDDSVAVIGKPATEAPTEHRINLLQPVYNIEADPGFAISEGVSTGDMHLVLDANRTMVVKAGTPGEISCAKLAEINQCVVAADLLGDAVVWFSLIPNPQKANLVLPGATSVREDNWLLLSNGWEVARSEVVERNCDAAGIKDFVDHFGGSLSTSTFSFDQQKIVKVTCLEEPENSTTTSSTSTTIGVPVVPGDTSLIAPDEVPLDTTPAQPPTETVAG